MGVNNIVVNPADVPSTQKEQLQKTDSMDSRKIARTLRSGELTLDSAEEMVKIAAIRLLLKKIQTGSLCLKLQYKICVVLCMYIANE